MEWSATTGHKDTRSPTDATPVLRFADDDSIRASIFLCVHIEGVDIDAREYTL